ncbi:hypothetical protein [Bradyrhizobium centrosematis]
MEDWFRLVILFDYLKKSRGQGDARLYDTLSAILFQQCNGEMKGIW